VSVRLYVDHHVRREITEGLRRRGVDVITAEQDGTKRLSDPELQSRASALGRVLISNDKDHLAEATRRQRSGEDFAGLVYAPQLRITIGQAVEDLELIAKVYDPGDMENRVHYLPL
jgi:hypothetical protein